MLLRKSTKAGPFRITASRSGLSTSLGIRHARVRKGTHGTFFSLAAKGLRYQHRVRY